ncbi:DNA binding protein [Staphylococcus phage Metroid]|nr:DNA binding protein [Staphylococcus phage Metroid]
MNYNETWQTNEIVTEEIEFSYLTASDKART